MNLNDILTPVRVSESEFIVNIPDGWSQGRGTFGGLVIGAMIRCVEISEPDPARRIRAVTCEICGPVLAGPARIQVQTLRRGTALSTVRASIRGAGEIQRTGEVLADLVAIVARSRTGTPTWRELAAPAMPPVDSVHIAAIEPPLGPEFARNVEFRVATGIPFMGAPESLVSGWVRVKNPGPVPNAAHLAVLIDSWWPAGATRFEGARPMGTVAFTMEILGSADDAAGAPVFYTGRAPISDDGYMVEFRELWSSDGSPLALNQQTIAIIK